MKLLSLILWVTQFGVSVLFPTVFFLWLGVWLRGRFGLGIWVLAVFGIFGLMTSFSTARSCLQSMRRAAEELSSQEKPPTAFNDHN